MIPVTIQNFTRCVEIGISTKAKGINNYIHASYATGNDPSGRGPAELLDLLGQVANKEIEYHFFHLTGPSLPPINIMQIIRR